jgi:DNA-binding protein HU-beta
MPASCRNLDESSDFGGFFVFFKINLGGITVNKTELMKKIAEKTGLKVKDVENVYHEFVESVSSSLASGEKVQLIGFGTFETRKRGARQGRNPQTGKPLHIAEATVPAFKPGKAFRDKVK